MAPRGRLVRVDLGPRSYDIAIGAGNLPDLGEFLTARTKVSHAVIVTDSNVEQAHALPAAESLAAARIMVDMVVVDPGEATKSADVAAGLWNKFLELGADRKSVVVAVGGGVIGDLAGFVAATFARGLRFVQAPTTLLAQVDSSVGGKVGINLRGAKNMVGAFWQPLGVMVDTAVLDTLPPREFRAGLAEVVKYGVILDDEFFAWLEANAAAVVHRENAALEHVVARSCELKALVVSADEREESGTRAVLNYGHTFCHALETLTGYNRLLHGEAVAIGMHCAARLAERLGRVDAEFIARQQRLLEKFGLSVEVPELDAEEVVSVMGRDKKVEHGRLRFVLPTRLGHVELVADVPADDVRAALGS